jgi:eukaryotic-like serine/threonine-protein kinase
MAPTSPSSCPRCGAHLAPRETPDTVVLCPACLLSGALADSGSDETGEAGEAGEAGDFPRELGDYRLLGLLGTGGMGTVYEAEHLPTGRHVALKMLEQALDSDEMRQRFLREGRLAASVSHPHSLYVFGSEEIEDRPVITMEIAGSGTLEDHLKKRGPFPVAEAADVILDVIAGLEAAYEEGVLHRDVKPSNCFVGSDGVVKVGDFGLSVSTMARDDSYATAAGVIMGTPAFAAPEQLRGDDLDVRADLYSVGATLFTLLTGRTPFDGANAVQVVANAVNQPPKSIAEFRDDVPPRLQKVIARLLAKEPEARFEGYAPLRAALLPFSSREPEAASMTIRAAAGWIDFLIAFLLPYILLMTLVGGSELLLRPVVERTFFAAKYYLAMFGWGFAYFAIVEGIWGAGLGKRLRGLRVVRRDGREPGVGRALVRILIPILSIELVRLPLSMALISDFEMTGAEVAWFVVLCNVCAWIPALLALTSRAESGWATPWDRLSGTRVVIAPKGSARPSVEVVAPRGSASEKTSFGPFDAYATVVASRWLFANDPVLRRPVWLLRREGDAPSEARRNVSREGRLRWLQKVEHSDGIWDVYEAPPGAPLSTLSDAPDVPWATMRHRLHDLATELLQGTRDGSLPEFVSLDHVWITPKGPTILLDAPWPLVDSPAPTIPIGDLSGQQRFLHEVAARTDGSRLPLHAAPVVRNLAQGRFEKLSFLTGTLRGLLDRPAGIPPALRAASVFMLPLFTWVLVYLGKYHGGEGETVAGPWLDRLLIPALGVLVAIAILQLPSLLFRSTASLAIFRLAVVDVHGARASRVRLLVRWALVWVPLFLLLFAAAQLPLPLARVVSPTILLLWTAVAMHTARHPHRGCHDLLAGTRVVRR